MSARLARLALGLYPLAYRRRYGAEMEGLVEDSGASPGAVADLLRGAVAAHLRPVSAVRGEVDANERIRLGLGSILLCWLFFAAAGLGLYKTAEGPAFAHAGDAHWLLGGAQAAIELLAVLGIAAVAVGAAPLAFLALRQRRERPAARRAALIAAGCVLAFVAATAAIDVVIHPQPEISPGIAGAILAVWAGVALATGLGCVLAARRGLAVIEIRPSLLRGSLLAARVLAAAMALIALATAVYLAALLLDAPALAGEGNGPGGVTSVAVALALQLGVMVLAATASQVHLLRSSPWRAAG